MRINCVSYPVFWGKVSKCKAKNDLYSGKIRNEHACDIFIKSNDTINCQTKAAPDTTKTSFRGLPYELNYPSQYAITGENAFNRYKHFAIGNYLDINGNPKDQKAKTIRKNNLSFLDKVRSEEDKKIFISKYEELTRFPDMKAVSEKIQQEFINACQKSQDYLQDSNPLYKECYEIIAAGFDGISSTAHNTAFPGSDLDKAYVILKGNDNDESNEITVKNFKWRLWENTDQRILSYNHDTTAFPEVYTVKQINSLANAINEKTEKMNLHEKKEIPRTTLYQRLFKPVEYEPTKYDKYKKLTTSFNNDYVAANQFIIDVANKFPKKYSWEGKIDYKNPSRENIYKASYVLESIAYGKTLVGTPFKTTLNSDAVDLINLSQIRAIKNSPQQKPKYERREAVPLEYQYWDTDKKFNFIKTMIKAGCTDNDDFEEYFQSSEEKRFNELLKALKLEG